MPGLDDGNILSGHPMDFFHWDHLTSKIYDNQPGSLDDLRNRIINECPQITPDMLSNVRVRSEQNLFNCMEVNRVHLQHLINSKVSALLIFKLSFR